MPLILILGAVYLLLNLAKQTNVSIDPVNISLNLNEGLPKFKLKLKIYNPSKLPLRITQISAIAIANNVKLGNLSYNNVFTVPPESTVFEYIDFRISTQALLEYKKVINNTMPNIQVAGYALANGVQVKFDKNV
jgi:LEA14-like dessication related protein